MSANCYLDGGAVARSGAGKMCAGGTDDAETNGIKQPLLHEAANGHAEDIIDASMAPERVTEI